MENNNFAIILAVIIGIVAIVGIAAFFISSQQTQVFMSPGSIETPMPGASLKPDCVIICNLQRANRERDIRVAFDACIGDATSALETCIENAYRILFSDSASCLTQHTDCQRNDGESDYAYYDRCRGSCTSDACLNCITAAGTDYRTNTDMCTSEHDSSRARCGQTRDEARAASDQEYRDCLARCKSGGVPR